MHDPALAHAAVEVAIGGGGTNLTFGQYPVAHAKAGPAGGIGNAKTGILENFYYPLF